MHRLKPVKLVKCVLLGLRKKYFIVREKELNKEKGAQI